MKGEWEETFIQGKPSDVCVQMTITKSKCVSFSFSSRPTDPTLLLIFSLQQEINLEWPNQIGIDFVHPDPCRSKFKPRPLIEKGRGYVLTYDL